MAERRMFAKSIIDSDAFTDMPLSTQGLYFHLALEADDDGFVNNPKQIKRMVGASDDDLKVLAAKEFIRPFESGVIVITHWRVHNMIRKDRYKASRCIAEKAMLYLTKSKEYVLDDRNGAVRLTDGKPGGNQTEPQVSVGKDRLGKDRLGECKYTLGNEQLSEEDYTHLIKTYGKETVDEVIHRILSHPYYGCLNKEKISEWCMDVKKRVINMPQKKKNGFANFQQRDYDFEELERTLLCNRG